MKKQQYHFIKDFYPQYHDHHCIITCKSRFFSSVSLWLRFSSEFTRPKSICICPTVFLHTFICWLFLAGFLQNSQFLQNCYFLYLQVSKFQSLLLILSLLLGKSLLKDQHLCLTILIIMMVNDYCRENIEILEVIKNYEWVKPASVPRLPFFLQARGLFS